MFITFTRERGAFAPGQKIQEKVFFFRQKSCREEKVNDCSLTNLFKTRNNMNNVKSVTYDFEA